jgi:hypothetical protein
VDRAVPTQIPAPKSLLEKKKQQWKQDKEDTWKTAYTQQYHDVCAESRQVNGEKATKQPSLSKMPRTHQQMGLRSAF